MTTEPYLTPQDVAELLRVNVRSVLRWVSEDPSLPAVRLGGGRVIRFERTRLLAWLGRKRQHGARERA